MIEQQKFDDPPPQEYIDLMNDSFKESEAFTKVPMDNWGKDKSHDFYLGMMTGIGIAIMGAQTMVETSAPPEAIVQELSLFNGQLSTIVKEKESRIITL